jgi:hypothetical protein
MYDRPHRASAVREDDAFMPRHGPQGARMLRIRQMTPVKTFNHGEWAEGRLSRPPNTSSGYPGHDALRSDWVQRLRRY